MEIYFEDQDILVCRKPAGVATQTKRLNQQDMESLLKNYRAEKKEIPYIGVVHRLDQPVEGIMVFGKTPEATRELNKQITTGNMDKCYYAVTDGVPKSREGFLVDYLKKDGRSNTSMVVQKGTPDAKEAKLFYRILAQNEHQAIWDIRLETGRHHQIRVQLAHQGCPLSGDGKYNPAAAVSNNKTPLALCSYRIGFLHPVSHQKLEFEIDNPFTLS